MKQQQMVHPICEKERAGSDFYASNNTSFEYIKNTNWKTYKEKLNPLSEWEIFNNIISN